MLGGMTDGTHPTYPNVFRPIAIGPHRLRNRIFVPAHTTNYGDANLPTDRHLEYHRARAAGGARKDPDAAMMKRIAALSKAK